MSAVLERERRLTAGKRMTFLAGQELENDETFWTHDTWQEDNESFHSSDAASSAEEDVFDSDFDESENDDDVIANEEMIGAAMEREIDQEERDSKKRSGSAYTELSNTIDSKKKAFGGTNRSRGKAAAAAAGVSGGVRRWPGGPNGKRIVGDGLNAGIVLNVPPQYQKTYGVPPTKLPSVSTASLQSSLTATEQLIHSTKESSSLNVVSLESDSSSVPVPVIDAVVHVDIITGNTGNGTIDNNGTILPDTNIEPAQLMPEDPKATVSFQLLPVAPDRKKRTSVPTLATSRVRRISHDNKSALIGNRSRKSMTSTQKITAEKTMSSPVNGLKRGKQFFSQEELLLEAVQVTERENERWLLGQKRIQAMKDDIETQLRNSSCDKNTKVIEKFVSRRGHYNTITFPDMDHLPNILQRRRSLSSTISEQHQEQSRKEKHLCFITGKVAKFRDPKSGYGYHDVNAFRELRRRLKANELPVHNTISKSESVDVDTVLPAVSTKMQSTSSNLTEKPKRRAKLSSNDAGTKRKSVSGGRTSIGKKFKEFNNSNGNSFAQQSTNNEHDIESATIDISTPLKRLRASSTGGESVNSSTMILYSKVYDLETLPHSSNASIHANVGNNNSNGVISNITSPPLSPGRRSPRTPKPTVKVLETARMITSSLLIPQQSHLVPSHFVQEPPNILLDNFATSTAIVTTQQPPLEENENSKIANT